VDQVTSLIDGALDPATSDLAYYCIQRVQVDPVSDYRDGVAEVVSRFLKDARESSNAEVCADTLPIVFLRDTGIDGPSIDLLSPDQAGHWAIAVALERFLSIDGFLEIAALADALTSQIALALPPADCSR
jgi:hypothetical protein